MSQTGNQHGSKGVEVFVGGLPRSISEDKVHKVFSTCGEIVEMRLIKDQKGSLKGFGFILFATKEAADRALKELSGSMLEGKKIGVLPSAAQDTLFIGNLNKGWSADDFDKAIRQVFPDVVSVDLATPSSGAESTLSKKFKNRGFGFVKFSSHAAAARAYRVGSKPNFVLGGTQHPSVQWAQEDNEPDPDELAKVKIAFVRNLPPSVDENYLTKLFVPYGEVDKVVVVSSKGKSSVAFVHFAQRSHLDKAIQELSDKVVQGPKGIPSFKLQVEVARPMEKKRKRVQEDPRSNQFSASLHQSKHRSYEPSFTSVGGHETTVFKESVVGDPYEAAVLSLPAAVKERLLRILRLGIATRFDVDIQSLTSLVELPESTAISVLDQFMLSGAEKRDKGAYLAALISKYRVDEVGVNQQPSSFSRLRDANIRDPVGHSSRVHLPPVNSLPLHADTIVPRSYTSRYSSLYSDYQPSSRAGIVRAEDRSPLLLHELPNSSAPYSRYIADSHLPPAYPSTEEMSPIPSHHIPGSSVSYGKTGPYPTHNIPGSSSPYADSHRLAGSSLAYGKVGAESHQLRGPLLPYGNAGVESHQLTGAYFGGGAGPESNFDRQPARPQMKFDPFTGQPYKFDPFTGEPIVPEGLAGPGPVPRESPY